MRITRLGNMNWSKADFTEQKERAFLHAIHKMEKDIEDADALKEVLKRYQRNLRQGETFRRDTRAPDSQLQRYREEIKRLKTVIKRKETRAKDEARELQARLQRVWKFTQSDLGAYTGWAYNLQRSVHKLFRVSRQYTEEMERQRYNSKDLMERYRDQARSFILDIKHYLSETLLDLTP